MSEQNQDSTGRGRAAVLVEGTDVIEIHEISVDEPGPDEIRLRIAATGLCHSDLHLIEGTIVRPRPIVLGHEGAGVVEAVGANVEHVAPGDHAVTCLVAGCGSCRRCQAGSPSMCTNPGATSRGADDPPRLALDGVPTGQMGNVGALAERTVMDARGVVPISPDMPMELAALLGCAVVTGLGAVFNVARVRPTERVAVIGCGGIGLNMVQGARIAGAGQIIAVDLAPAKLELARRLGATHVVDASDGDPVAAVTEISGGVDHAFEAIGLTATAEQAIAMAAPDRAAYVTGILPGDASVSMSAGDLRRGKSLVGVWMGSTRPHEDIPHYVELWQQGRLDLETMVSQVLPPEQVNEGFAAMTGGEVARTVIGWNGA